MLAFISSASPLAALCLFAGSWVVLAALVGVAGSLRLLALALLRFALAQLAVRRLRSSRLLPSGRSQSFIPSSVCRRAHWGLQFPLLWQLRGRWVRFQASRRFAALQRSRAAA